MAENKAKAEKIEEMKRRIELIKWRREVYMPATEKSLLNKYLEYKGNIRVFIRSRPILPIDFRAYDGTKESFEKLEKATKVYNAKQIELEITPDANKKEGVTEKLA